MSFIIGGVYQFDSIYARCPYKIIESNCCCNNGYLCSRDDNLEACSHNLSKCYSFSCPIVVDCASKEDILRGLGDYDITDIENLCFDDEGYTLDSEECVVLLEDIN